MLKLIIIKIDTNHDYHRYMSWFTQDEIKHIKSFIKPQDQVTAFTSILCKKYLIQKYSNEHKQLSITKNIYGKPYINNTNNLFFNISHQNEYIVLAIADQEVGIDIEYCSNIVDMAITKIIFTPKEAAQITTQLDFFKLWTKKEAYLKCIGCGFLSDDYTTSELNLAVVQEMNNYLLTTFSFTDNYLISICLRNS